MAVASLTIHIERLLLSQRRHFLMYGVDHGHFLVRLHVRIGFRLELERVKMVLRLLSILRIRNKLRTVRSKWRDRLRSSVLFQFSPVLRVSVVKGSSDVALVLLLYLLSRFHEG